MGKSKNRKGQTPRMTKQADLFVFSYFLLHLRRERIRYSPSSLLPLPYFRYMIVHTLKTNFIHRRHLFQRETFQIDLCSLDRFMAQ